MAKQTTVALVVDGGNIKTNFNFEHAERLLNMPNNGGWMLPSDSPFTFSKEHGLEFRKNKKRDKGAEETGDNK